MRVTVGNSALFFLSLSPLEIRESHFTAKSLRMLFKDISPEKIFNFLKFLEKFKFEIVFSYVCVFTF